MIVLDEQIDSPEIAAEIARWYRGTVTTIKALHPQTVIKDEAMPMLFRTVKQPTLVTINYKDFWKAKSYRSCLLYYLLRSSAVKSIRSSVYGS